MPAIIAREISRHGEVAFTGQDRRHFRKAAFNFLQLGQRQIMQPLRAKFGEVDLIVKNGPKKLVLLSDCPGDLLHRRDDLLTGPAVDHDHNVFFVPKLLGVLEIALIEFALEIDNVTAARAVSHARAQGQRTSGGHNA